MIPWGLNKICNKNNNVKLTKNNKISNNNVSNCIGNNNNNNRSREKRDLNNNNAQKRRVVKKLVRKEPVQHQQMSTTTTEEIQRNKRRRKIKIKKKKRLLNATSVSDEASVVPSSYLTGIEEDQHGQEATKPRRKVIITRKRILPNINKTATAGSAVEGTAINNNEAEKIGIAKHFRENMSNIAQTHDGEETVTNPTIEEAVTEADEDDEYYYDDDDEEYINDQDDYGNSSGENKDEEYYYDDNEEEEGEKNNPNEETAPLPNSFISSSETEEQSIKNSTISLNNPNPSSEILVSNNYEPFFPELTESTDGPVLLLKTTIVSNLNIETKTITSTNFRSHTFVITELLAENSEIVTTTTEIRPQIETSTVTETSTLFTTLTLLDLDGINNNNNNMDKTDVQPNFLPTLEYNISSLSNTDEDEFREEPRNLATRIMSNGVEVIVAGDKSHYPGDNKDFKKTGSQKPITLKPSTVTDHMLLMAIPQETNNNIQQNSNNALDPNQFVVKTCLTTFTYLTTYLEKGTTTVSSHEQVVSNVATEERLSSTGKILPTPAMGITVTQYPNLSVGLFHTTYTYLNTYLDGKEPIVYSSQHVVTNTVTAPDDYLSLLKPSSGSPVTPVKDTNTYFSTIDLESILYEGTDGTSVISTRDVITQVVITESIPPRPRPVMTSYIALDKLPSSSLSDLKVLTDVLRTDFITYTYTNTVTENGIATVYTNVTTESDVVTENLYLPSKRSSSSSISSSSIIQNKPKFDIIATRTYFTTFTYLTTLLKENDPQQTIINSRTKVVENVVAESLATNLFDSKLIHSLSDDVNKLVSGSFQRVATLLDGHVVDITVKPNYEEFNEIKPTSVLPIIEKTEMLHELSSDVETLLLESSFSTTKPNVITGSTIVYIDDDPFANLVPTPSLNSATSSTNNNAQIMGPSSSALLSSEVVKETNIDIVTQKVKRPANSRHKNNKQKLNPSKTSVASSSSAITTSSLIKRNDKPSKNNNKKTHNVIKPPITPASDLLSLGSININTLQALTPVLSAMAGYINKNLKSNRRQDVNETDDGESSSNNNATHYNNKNIQAAVETQNRSPVYIPVGGALGDDFEIAESQNIATFEWSEPSSPSRHESPLLGSNGIPISPGDIITANSDVIVGKPGRVAPRLPTNIPLHHQHEESTSVDGMKPPPLPEQQNNHNIIPLINNNDQVPSPTNIIHAPNKDDYVGPPPPPPPPTSSSASSSTTAAVMLKENFRGEKRKHIPLQHFSYENNYYETPNNNNNNAIPTSLPLNLQETIQINNDDPPPPPPPVIYTSANNNENKFIFPSRTRELPEVIERSTGQLLVNLQPSQVAIVKIPLNGSTALIYGGSTETHHNGQYFDDPVPYPDADTIYEMDHNLNNNIKHHQNNINQFSDTIQKTPPLLNDGIINQKQVSGVITVGTHHHQHHHHHHHVKTHVEPDTSSNEEIPNIRIAPSHHHRAEINRPSSFIGVNPHKINNIVNLEPEEFISKPVIARPVQENKHLKHHHLHVRNNKPKYPTQNRPSSSIRHRYPLKIAEFMTPPPKSVNNNNGEIPNISSYLNYSSSASSETPTRQFSNFNNGYYNQDNNNNNFQDGVVEESHYRPLKSGEIPLEVVTQSTTEADLLVRFPDSFRNTPQVRFPYEKHASTEKSSVPMIQQHQGIIFGSSQVVSTGTVYDNNNNRRPSSHGTNSLISSSNKTRILQSTTFSAPSTTSKPILIFIDQNGKRDDFLHAGKRENNNNNNNSRPKVTSLPIDTATSIKSTTLTATTTTTTQKTPRTTSHHVFPLIEESQTEKAFNNSKYPIKHQTNEVNIVEEPKKPLMQQQFLLNKGENLDFSNLTQEINNMMEVLQPPPLVLPPPSKIPSLSMEPPPKLDSPTSSTIPEGSATTEIVIGMNPPPVPPSRKPVKSNIFIKEINNTPKPLEFTPPHNPRTRKPHLRRKTTTTTSTTTILPPAPKITTRRPTYHHHLYNISRNKSQSIIRPTPTIKITTSSSAPSMDIIVGQPHLIINNKEEKSSSSSTSSTTSSTTTTTEKSIRTTTPEAVPEIITKPIHHAGNEVKVVDDTKIHVLATPVLPTRYITHTKTHTVTITITTTLKTSGGPPITLTVPVTKTETSYTIETITEVHTLVKPTSIFETVTTTVEKGATKNTYSILKLKPTNVLITSSSSSSSSVPEPTIITSSVEEEPDDETLDIQTSPINNFDSNESYFIVMTDKNKTSNFKIPSISIEEDDDEDSPLHRDEITENEVNNILLSGILSANPLEINEENKLHQKSDKCYPECRVSKNELCQKVDGLMRCVCRSGFFRMFPDRPCIPLYTYSVNITIAKIGKNVAKYSKKLAQENTTQYIQLMGKVQEGLLRMVMQSDLRDVSHGVNITGFYPSNNGNNKGIISNFYLQLSDNIEDQRIKETLKKQLRSNNYSLGGIDVITSAQTVENLSVQDFNECSNRKFHDCSENSQCFNLKGTYTCSCKEGFSDLSENLHYPGRVCSAEQVGCEKCNYHGMCYSRGNNDENLCECFHWYAGEHCQINLKIFLIGLVTLGTVLFALLFVCVIITCVRKKPRNSSNGANTIGFLPQRASNSATRSSGTLDRRAMIEDTSSEDSRSETNLVPPYVQQKPSMKLKPPPAKGALKKNSKISMISTTTEQHLQPQSEGVIFPDQKDRSLTVMIPRAKYHPSPPNNNLANYTTFDARKPSVPNILTQEAKLLSYLDAGPTPSRTDIKRKYSTSTSVEQFIDDKTSSRKTSGALISAGFEVSATVLNNNMGTLGTTITCGTEADRSENATLIQKISTDLLSRADTSSQFNTLRRKSLVDDDLESESNWMDIPRVSTVSESRSYDETTIPPPMKSFTRSEYDEKSLQHQTDEANTMAERDLGSTFLLPHTHLYKPDRGSDLSGFESL